MRDPALEVQRGLGRARPERKPSSHDRCERADGEEARGARCHRGARFEVRLTGRAQLDAMQHDGAAEAL